MRLELCTFVAYATSDLTFLSVQFGCIKTAISLKIEPKKNPTHSAVAEISRNQTPHAQASGGGNRQYGVIGACLCVSRRGRSPGTAGCCRRLAVSAAASLLSASSQHHFRTNRDRGRSAGREVGSERRSTYRPWGEPGRAAWPGGYGSSHRDH